MIAVTESTVECPVMGCSKKVARQHKSFRRKPEFQCPEHRIYISPSTFEYECETDNLLWAEPDDLALLRAIKSVKREVRMARNNSEDALTWNVFRHLERSNQLPACLSAISGSLVTDPEVIYWSYSQKVHGVCPELARARSMFGEHAQQSSEPDVIIISDQAVFWIEAKLTATNRTFPSNPNAQKEYLTGGGSWYQQVFREDYQTVALCSRKYELMRFWLLGSWMAAQVGRAFYLVNVVLAEREQDIEAAFKPFLMENDCRRFIRVGWESLYGFLSHNDPLSKAQSALLGYFEDRTIGYKRLGELQRAFSLTADDLSWRAT